MKRTIKLSFVAAFAVGRALLWLVHSEPQRSFASEVASPRSLYLANCARCHGADGKAQTALGRKLEADNLTASTASTAKIIRAVTNGRGDMPSFKKRLTAKQIASIAGYVRSL